MINNKSETILCSAVWFKDLPLLKPEVLEPRGYRPYNVDRGIVFSGWRHHNCIYSMVAITGKRQCEAGESIQVTIDLGWDEGLVHYFIKHQPIPIGEEVIFRKTIQNFYGRYLICEYKGKNYDILPKSLKLKEKE